MKIVIDNPDLSHEECSILEDIEKIYNESNNQTMKEYLWELLQLYLTELSKRHNLGVEHSYEPVKE
jgi:hypothetical protein